MTDENFFEKFNLAVTSGTVEVGQSYPLYGMITGIFDEDPSNVVIVINYQVKLSLHGTLATDRLAILRSRAFEPGIFVSTVTKVDFNLPVPDYNNTSIDTEFPIEADCSTIVYGKQANTEVN